MTILVLIGMVFATASELCEWVHVGIDVYIPNRKYQVKPHTSPWSSAACAVAIVHRYLFFFRFYQHNKSCEPQLKFRQDSKHCKKILGSWQTCIC